MQPMRSPIGGGKVRQPDRWGRGEFDAPRGDRRHKGVDIAARVGDPVMSPIQGKIERTSFPYANDRRYSGVLLRGEGEHQGLRVKIFYVLPKPRLIGRSVRPGDVLGHVQDLSAKYPGITNHVHVEARRNGIVVDPWTLVAGAEP